MVFPVVIYFALFKYLPMFFLRASLYDYKLLKGFDGSRFVGFENFAKLFSDSKLLVYIANTLKLNICALVFLFPAPVVFAVMLNELRSPRLMKAVQMISYLPHFVSTVVLVSLIGTFVSPSIGTLARVAKAFGATPVNYLSQPESFIAINVISGFWQSVGWEAVIYTATLVGIDEAQYEAARIDGANRILQIIHVTLPGLSQTFFILLIMQIGQMLNVNFEKIYLLQNTLNLSSSEMLPTFAYKAGMESHQYGYATAAGLFNSVCSVALVLAANAVSKRAADVSLF